MLEGVDVDVPDGKRFVHMAVVRKLHDPDAKALLFGHFCRNFSHLGMRPGQGSELDFLLSCLLSAAGKRKRQDGRDCCNHNTALHSGCLLFFSVYQSHKAPDLRNTLPGRSCGRDSPPPGLCCITLLNAFSFSCRITVPDRQLRPETKFSARGYSGELISRRRTISDSDEVQRCDAPEISV